MGFPQDIINPNRIVDKFPEETNPIYAAPEEDF